MTRWEQERIASMAEAERLRQQKVAEREKAILRQQRLGATRAAIAKSCGTSPSVVDEVLAKHGLKPESAEDVLCSYSRTRQMRREKRGAR